MIESGLHEVTFPPPAASAKRGEFTVLVGIREVKSPVVHGVETVAGEKSFGYTPLRPQSL
jgi:hypothetical protein